MLTVENLKKDYEGKPLLNGVSFEARKGELVCLLGSSGSGKSTILRIIAGLEAPDGGMVRWDGHDLSHVPTHKRGFGLMFQDYALFPHRSVAQNIAFGLEMQGLNKDEIGRIVQASLESIRMQSFADRPVTELSGGEQQRVALARALAPSPRMLMLDEPLGALDHTLRDQLTRELRAILHQSQIPIIYVTHDRDEAFSLADRLVILHDGIILQQGSPQDLFEQPQDPWIAEYLGLGNLLSGSAVHHNPLIIKTDLAELTLPDQAIPILPGQACQLLLRPEDAQTGEQALNLGFSVEGIVQDSLFLGEYFQLELLCGSRVLRVRSQTPAEIGKTIRLGWPAGKIGVFASQ